MGGETLRCSGCGASLAPSQLHPKSGDQWEPPDHPHIIHARDAEPEHPCLSPTSTWTIAVIHTGSFARFCTIFQNFFFFLVENSYGGLARNPALLGINLPRWLLLLVMVRNQPVPRWVGCWKLWFRDLCWWQMVRSCQLSANALKKINSG